MVGFNRRFAPLLIALQQLQTCNGPKSFVYTCNAGAIHLTTGSKIRSW